MNIKHACLVKADDKLSCSLLAYHDNFQSRDTQHHIPAYHLLDLIIKYKEKMLFDYLLFAGFYPTVDLYIR